MITDIFNTLPKIEGMEAVVIYNQSNNIIDSWTLPSFSSQILEELGLSYQQIFEMLEPLGESFREIVLNFDKDQIYAKYQEEFLLIAVSKKHVDIPLIRLVVNVGFEKYLKSRKVKKIFRIISGKRTRFLKENAVDSVEAKYLEKMRTAYNANGIEDDKEKML